MLHHGMKKFAKETPSATAAYCDGAAFSYETMFDRTRRIATALHARGVGLNDRVALFGPKSINQLCTMHAVMALGAAYVPLDPRSPPERVRKVTSHCGVKCIVTSDASWSDDRCDMVIVSENELVSQMASTLCLPVDDPERLAYILYTSGSTGEPKGVCISHRAAYAFVAWATDNIGVNKDDILSNHAGFHFDLSVFDIYAALTMGASVSIVPRALDIHPKGLVDFIKNQSISVWYSVPTVIRMMMEQGGLIGRDLPSLRNMIFAGEVFPLSDLRVLRKSFRHIRMHNWYGPTETNVCTAYEIKEIDDHATSIPIGTAASGDRVWLSDDGEICVEGPSVMHGYWGDKALKGRCYATGDHGYLDANNQLNYVGRSDDLVKIRGHRISPLEIQACIATYPSIQDVAVVAYGDVLNELVACVVVKKNHPAPSLLSIKRHCSEKLPPSMTIDRIVVFEKLPTNTNGKIDRKSLQSSEMIRNGKIES